MQWQWSCHYLFLDLGLSQPFTKGLNVTNAGHSLTVGICSKCNIVYKCNYILLGGSVCTVHVHVVLNRIPQSGEYKSLFFNPLTL